MELANHNTKQVISTERKNSYEFGKAGARHKIYYDKIEELETLVIALTAAGFIKDE
jgi:hypothetical protein